MERFIKIKGARQHNLKNIDISIPHEKLTVITGVSGSGKTTLAFDTIYAEGQRRYVESLSSYARQFLELSEKPDVDHIDGLSPSISIQQRKINQSPRSIVGTVTEIYDYLRLLYARTGTVHCYSCGREVEKSSVENIVDKIEELKNEKIYIMAPLVSGRKGIYDKMFPALVEEGYLRIMIDGEEFRLDEELPKLDKNTKHSISLVVDRFSVKEGMDKDRLWASVETALVKGEGLLEVKILSTQEIKIFSEKFGCPYCGIYYDEIEPRTFSFNNPAGACEECNGLGFKMEMDEKLIVAHPEKHVGLAIDGVQDLIKQMMFIIIKEEGEDPKTPFKKLPEKIQKILLYGSRKKYNFNLKSRGSGMLHSKTDFFEGIIPLRERWYRETSSEDIRNYLEKFLKESECRSCHGKRLTPKALAVTIADFNIFEMGEIEIEKLEKIFADREKFKFDDFKWKIADKLVNEIGSRLHFLTATGLGYLTLNRKTGTLSGGESQRIHLATQIGSALTGVTYVLDEPSIGLHPEDTEKLINILKNLRDQGNNVLVVEHDREIMEASDFIVDLGPAAGTLGGELIYVGDYEGILKSEKSLTGKYLSERLSIPLPASRRKPSGFMKITGVTTNNLKNVTAEFPLAVFTCITGMSGSGKSSLIMETLLNALRKEKGTYKTFTTDKEIGDIVEIDQSPIGQTPRSNPATYTQAFGPIRDLFASLPLSKSRGYQPGRFSFNVKGGRCENCQGAGVIKIEMNFMPDAYIKCPHCDGKRFNRETLDVKFKGYSIHDILEMEVEQSLEVFEAFPPIKRKLDLLHNIGLGYIKLGQPAHTLSGGEAQRIKLSKELAKKRSDNAIYILDEPTTGLHFDDIKKLIEILFRLVEKGSTVIVIEHNMDVIKCADYIIDLGPEGGTSGGEIVAFGTPEEVAESKKSLTAKYLKKELKK